MDRLLMPFQFIKRKNKFLISNLVGEHLFISDKEFEFFITEQYGELTEETKMGLESHNFLVDKNNLDLAENLLATKLRSRKNYLKHFTSLHMVVLTLRCNCFCDYCHASSKDVNSKDVDMDINTAKSVLDCILHSPSNDIKIEFQGGEPTLNWETLEFFVLEGERKIQDYKDKKISFVVCTNLMELSDKQLEFLKFHKVEISTSCDGPQFYHDLHRKSRDGKSSYEGFLCNLKRVREAIGPVSALLTVTKDNLTHLREIIDHYYLLGFKSIFIRALNPYGYANVNKKELAYSMDDFVKCYSDALNYIFEMNMEGKFFIEAYASLIFQRIMTPFSTGFVDLQSPSGAGISGAIYFYNGDVYPADEARMLATVGDNNFKMGNVLKDNYLDIFKSKVLKDIVWNSCVESMPECTTCVYAPYCGADPIRYYVESKDIVGKRNISGFCKKNKGIFNILFDLIEENDSKKIAILWSWVQHRPKEEWMLSCTH
jgi:His-Xaa-Ser system radical SAM maturase HxsB